MSWNGKCLALFVPGAWHGPESYGRVPAILRSNSVPTECVSLPSTGAKPPLESFDADVEAIRKVLVPIVEEGCKVVAVAHSYGSLPLNEALEGMTYDERKAAGKTGGVVAYVFISAFITPPGSSLMDMIGGKDLPWFIVNKERTEAMPDNPRKIFYNDMSDEEAQKWIDRLKPFSYRAWLSKTKYPGYRHTNCVYIHSDQDNAVPLAVQKKMVEDSGVAEWHGTTIKGAGHCPMLSHDRDVSSEIFNAWYAWGGEDPPRSII